MEEWTQDEFLMRLKRKERGVYFLYTPFCGTCQLAERMLHIVKELLPNLPFGKMNLNLAPDLAQQFKIESVPCLLIYDGGNITEKIYAFHSVSHLYERLKKYNASSHSLE